MSDGYGDGGVAATVAAELDRRVGGRSETSIFPALTGGLDTLGRIEDVVTRILSEDPPVTLHEFRSRLDLRPQLDASNAAVFFDWLYENIGQSEHLPGFFRRHGLLVRVPRIGEAGWIPPEKGDDGPAQVRRLSPAALLDIIQHRFWVYREKTEIKKEPKSSTGEQKIVTRFQVMAAREPASLAIDGAAEWQQVPEVETITHTQCLRPDGSLISEPGYDARSKTLYLPDDGKPPPRWPEGGQIPAEWVGWSRDTLNLLLRDFPFETPRHKLNMLALMLTPLLRKTIPHPYPMFIINAHQAGTGKSLLAKICGELHGSAHRPDPTSAGDEELRKQITSVLTTTTAPIVVLDNIGGRIESTQFANMLTTTTWSDRLLGTNQNVVAENDRLWVATGNNVQIGGDMGRRVARISLDAISEHPELRTGFGIPDILGYVRTYRGTLLQALLVQVLWWVQEGRPQVDEIRSDDYALWAKSMAAILKLGGLDETGEFMKPEKNEGATASTSDVETRDLWLMLKDVFGVGREFQIKDLKRTVLEPGWSELIMDSLPSHCAAQRDPWKSLGRYIAGHEKEVRQGLRCEEVRDARGGKVYRLVEVAHEY